MGASVELIVSGAGVSIVGLNDGGSVGSSVGPGEGTIVGDCVGTVLVLMERVVNAKAGVGFMPFEWLHALHAMIRFA